MVCISKKTILTEEHSATRTSSMAKNPFDSEYAQWFRVADTGASLGLLKFTGSQHPAFVYSFRLAVAPRFGYCLIAR